MESTEPIEYTSPKARPEPIIYTSPENTEFYHQLHLFKETLATILTKDVNPSSEKYNEFVETYKARDKSKLSVTDLEEILQHFIALNNESGSATNHLQDTLVREIKKLMESWESLKKQIERVKEDYIQQQRNQSATTERNLGLNRELTKHQELLARQQEAYRQEAHRQQEAHKQEIDAKTEEQKQQLEKSLQEQQNAHEIVVSKAKEEVEAQLRVEHNAYMAELMADYEEEISKFREKEDLSNKAAAELIEDFKQKMELVTSTYERQIQKLKEELISQEEKYRVLEKEYKKKILLQKVGLGLTAHISENRNKRIEQVAAEIEELEKISSQIDPIKRSTQKIEGGGRRQRHTHRRKRR
jgi:hypothetical protein